MDPVERVRRRVPRRVVKREHRGRPRVRLGVARTLERVGPLLGHHAVVGRERPGKDVHLHDVHLAVRAMVAGVLNEQALRRGDAALLVVLAFRAVGVHPQRGDASVSHDELDVRCGIRVERVRVDSVRGGGQLADRSRPRRRPEKRPDRHRVLEKDIPHGPLDRRPRLALRSREDHRVRLRGIERRPLSVRAVRQNLKARSRWRDAVETESSPGGERELGRIGRRRAGRQERLDLRASQISGFERLLGGRQGGCRVAARERARGDVAGDVRGSDDGDFGAHALGPRASFVRGEHGICQDLRDDAPVRPRVDADVERGVVEQHVSERLGNVGDDIVDARVVFVERVERPPRRGGGKVSGARHSRSGRRAVREPFRRAVTRVLLDDDVHQRRVETRVRRGHVLQRREAPDRRGGDIRA